MKCRIYPLQVHENIDPFLRYNNEPTQRLIILFRIISLWPTRTEADIKILVAQISLHAVCSNSIHSLHQGNLPIYF